MNTPIYIAQEIMGDNFLGLKQINILLEKIGRNEIDLSLVPDVNYEIETLEKYCKDYILVLGTDVIEILTLRRFFGIDPEVSEPCFYNQDWYLSEDFISKRMENRWYLIKKNAFEETRGVIPSEISAKGITFPSAILCTFTFFAYYLSYGEMLWYHDFIWCSDVDHNGDRIYVGKYHDIDGVNKNGFSIHRHLSLRPCYASIDLK